MSSAGHISAMLSKLKNNALKKRNHTFIAKGYKKSDSNGDALKFKNKLSDIEFGQLKQRLKIERKRQLILSIILLLSTLIPLYFFLFKYL